MIQEAKDILEKIVKDRIPQAVIVRSFAEEQRAVNARKYPLVALITNSGNFDDRKARTFRRYDAAEETWKQQYVRGSRILPLQVRVWDEGEEKADAVFSRIIPAIPRHWELDGFEGLIVINWEEHSDQADTVSKLYLSVAEVQFTVDVALEEEIVPTIAAVEVEPDTIQQL
ncbi:MAG: hypothetical protein LBK83_07675 [Treponema sp.]|jgi:hypothetical protein|nr:hypothetical protein [Treponema sp.]